MAVDSVVTSKSFQFGNKMAHILTYNHSGAGPDTLPTNLPTGAIMPKFSSVDGIWLTTSQLTVATDAAKIHMTTTAAGALSTLVVTFEAAVTAVVTIFILGN
jgi:hypothetical protein